MCTNRSRILIEIGLLAALASAQFTVVPPNVHIKDLPGLINGNLVNCGGINDSATLQAANTAGSVYEFVPNETCLIDAVVNLTNAGVTWHLHGSTLKRKNPPSDFSGGASPTVVLSLNANNLTISDGSVDANGVLQGLVNGNYALVYGQGSNLRVERMVFLNSGSTLVRQGGIYLNTWSGSIRDNAFRSILGWAIFSVVNLAGEPVQIKGNYISASQHGGIAVWGGQSTGQTFVTENLVENITAIDSGSGECGSNTGECGNGISLYQQGGQNTVAHNHTGPTTFSGIRVNQSSGTLVQGNEIGFSDEAALILECASCAANSYIGGNRAIGNHIHDSLGGISATDVASRIGYSSQVSQPDLIDGNTLENIRSTAIYAEQAHVSNNVVTGAPECFVIGNGTFGYGNLLSNNSCINSGIPLAVSKDLVNNPYSQLWGIITSTNAVTGPAVGMANNSWLTVTAAVDNAGSLQLTTNPAPAQNAVYLLTAFYGMTAANGKLCTASASATTFTCVGLPTPSGTFGPNPATDVGAKAFLVYSSGTTPAYSLPSAFIDKH